MPSPRTAVAVLGAAVLGLGLAGCEKPRPLVTVTAGGRSYDTEAGLYCRTSCVTYSTTSQVVTVSAGAQVSVDVARSLLENGWIVVFPQQGQLAGPYSTHNATPINAYPGNATTPMQVIELLPGQRDQIKAGNLSSLNGQQAGTATRFKGVWSFQLRPAAV